jgi:hypothetical protein
MKKCGRCHSTLLEEYFDSNRKGELKKCCRGCLKTHKCPTCAKGFTINYYLQRHISTVHLKEKNHKCPTCDISFGEKGNLQHHIKTVHLNEKNYRCPNCDQSFGDKRDLQRHTSTVHLNERNFKCLQCDRSFGRNSVLQTHIKCVHLLQNKEVKCPTCDYRCSTNSSLQIHIKAIHLQIKDLKCPTCDQCWSSQGNFQTHIKLCTGTRNCSSGEFEIMKTLDSLGFKENTDYFYNESYDNVRDKSLLRFDFRLETADEPIFIEFDGAFHYFPIRKSSVITPEEAEAKHTQTKKRDKIKNDYCNDNGLLLLRIPYWEQKNIHKIVSDFLAENTV